MSGLHVRFFALASFLGGCTAEWTLEDVDGDGYTVADGDCWESVEGPEGSGVSGSAIFPGASDKWYDGVDQNCDGADDYDADSDGFVPDEYVGLATVGVDGTGSLEGGDCWDDPSNRPDAYTAMHGLYDAGGAYAAAGAAVPVAATVNPSVVEDLPYDGIDSDCAGDDADGNGTIDDFDVDGDGEQTQYYADRSGSEGTDCIDCGEGDACLADDNPSGAEPAAVNTSAEEIWYDGTNDDCDVEENDCDADGDSYPASGTGEDTEFCDAEDCDDDNENRFPDGSDETYYNGIDDNCDLDDQDGDMDGDSYWAADYEDLVNANPDKLDDPLDIPEGFDGDCDDSGEDLTALNSFSDLNSDEIHPDATERYYDGIDQDCNSATADFDWDGDGYTSLYALDEGGGLGDDCNDCALSCTDNTCAEFSIVCSQEPENPGGVDPDAINLAATETWYDGTDADCAGADSDGNGSEDDYDYDADGHESDSYGGDDCDDDDATANPSETEDCDTETVDEDCSGSFNDQNPLNSTTYYADVDGDGYGHYTDSQEWCEGGDGDYDTTDNTDCDDNDDTVNPDPATTELCDGQDNDCDGDLDSDEEDDDGDGYVECEEDSGGWDGSSTPGFEDCDDDDDTIYPSADELCDGLDNDCDSSVPSDEGDDDGDLYVECSVDADGYDASASIVGGDDCDDGEATVYPGATEVCDGQYNDCDDSEYSASSAPDDETDDDSDAYVECEWDSGGWDGTSSVTGDEDCDDDDDSVYPTASEVCDGQYNDCDDTDYSSTTAPDDELDNDNDGYVECTVTTWVGYPGSGTKLGDDCDDGDEDINPGETEVCDDDDTDEDCSGLADDDDSGVDTSTYTTWYLDSDGDYHVSSSASSVSQCEEPSDPGGDAQYLTSDDYSSAEDCDDADEDINPDAEEVCDASDVDEDCDGGADDADPDGNAVGASEFYEDNDGDGYGDESGTAEEYCDTPASGYSATNDDCVDSGSDGGVAAADINPGADEECDDIDNDCDDLIDDDDTDNLDTSTGSTFYIDADGDGYGESSTSTDACEVPTGYADNDDDCLDSGSDNGVAAEDINPDADEVCDDVDNNCDGDTDDDDTDDLDTSTASTWYEDADGDGFGVSSSTDLACEEPSGFVDNDEDCLDSGSDNGVDAADISPLEDEVCSDGVDNDCNSDTTCTVTEEFSNASAVLDGAGGDDDFGRAVLLFDANGDGDDDMIVGAPEAESGGNSTGEVYVILSPTSATAPSTSGGTFTQETRSMGSASDYDALLSGGSNNIELGGGLADAGSQDGDLYADLLVTAAVGDSGASNAGDVYLFLGPVTTSLDTSSADAQINGQTAKGQLGLAMVGEFDFAGSGSATDFLLGERGDTTTSPDDGNAGAAYLFYGGVSSGTLTPVSANVSFSGDAADDAFGHSVAAGDVDGDGLDDVLVGAPYADPSAGSSAGAAYLFIGDASPSSAIAASSADAVFEGQQASDGAGWSVAIVEVSGDGYADIVVGADRDDDGGSASGVTYVIFGDSSPSDTPLSGTDAVIAGAEASDRSGTEHAAGDLDGDGTDDLIVGAFYADNDVGSNISNTGAIAIFYGPVSGSFDFDGGDVLTAGEAQNDLAGYAVSVGDTDGDAYAEILVGAPAADSTDTNAGSAYLLIGVGE